MRVVPSARHAAGSIVKQQRGRPSRAQHSRTGAPTTSDTNDSTARQVSRRRVTVDDSGRLQVQERLTDEVADAIQEVLQPRGVVIEAMHLCMMMRGVEKQNAKTITSALRGQFRECPMTRDEFFRLAHPSA